MKDVQAAREAFSPQKRTSNATKHEISSLLVFSQFLGLFSPFNKKTSKKTNDFYYFVTSFCVLFLKTDVNVPFNST
jgi:hypothetical protein